LPSTSRRAAGKLLAEQSDNGHTASGGHVAGSRQAAPEEDTMLELIAMVAGLAVCVWLPIEMNKIRKGWVHKKFAGDRPKFLAAYRKQIRALMLVGLVVGVAGIGMAAIADQRAESIVKLIGAAIWFAVSGIAYTSRRALEQIPDTEPATGSGA
jgi:FtsH-binding integral membrane protein